MKENSKIYVAGGRTLVGSAILGALGARGYTNVVNTSCAEPDLTDPSETGRFFRDNAPEYVFLAAGESGGIRANQKHPADLIRNNLLVACHAVHGAWRFGVKKLLYLASSCSYPRDCPQPMRTEQLMTGHLEATNEAYATAKIAGIALCKAYKEQHGMNIISAIPANVFGPGDDFSPEDSHVIAALILRMHEAKLHHSPRVEIWGSGFPVRDFLFSGDLADACIFLMKQPHTPSPVNIGTGSGISIREIAERIRDTVGYPGALYFDASKPDGMPRKVLDTRAMASMGWTPGTGLGEALRATYDGYLARKQARHGGP